MVLQWRQGFAVSASTRTLEAEASECFASHRSSSMDSLIHFSFQNDRFQNGSDISCEDFGLHIFFKWLSITFLSAYQESYFYFAGLGWH